MKRFLYSSVLSHNFFPEGTKLPKCSSFLVVQFQVWKKQEAGNKRRKTLKVRKRTKLPTSPLVSVQQRCRFTFLRAPYFTTLAVVRIQLNFGISASYRVCLIDRLALDYWRCTRPKVKGTVYALFTVGF